MLSSLVRIELNFYFFLEMIAGIQYVRMSSDKPLFYSAQLFSFQLVFVSIIVIIYIFVGVILYNNDDYMLPLFYIQKDSQPIVFWKRNIVFLFSRKRIEKKKEKTH